MAEYTVAQKKAVPERTPNRTGIPVGLKERIEQSSGLSLSDVRIHYNSDKPSKVGALAYAQGNHVYMGRGQEKYLPHELGHVIQQRMGIVRPTVYSGGMAVNDDPGLERQADEIGRGVLQARRGSGGRSNVSGVVQKTTIHLQEEAAADRQGLVGELCQADGASDNKTKALPFGGFVKIQNNFNQLNSKSYVKRSAIEPGKVGNIWITEDALERYGAALQDAKK